MNLLTRPLPPPPEGLRRGPLRAGRFPSRLHDPRVASLLGIWLGVAFTTCFVTGLVSHFMQHPAPWLQWPSRPVNLYRVTQGLHVATGLATVPLLLAKLWTVAPLFWKWPPLRSVAGALERVSIIPLVGGALFQLSTGIANIAQWYPFRFFFTVAHYWGAWVTMGALFIHVGAKIVIVRANVGPGREARAAQALRTGTTDRISTPEPPGAGLSRRGLLMAVTAASGVITIVTVGQSLPGLSDLAVLAPRKPDLGPQRLPVNKTAAGARVLTKARDPAYTLEVVGPRPFTLSLAALMALPHVTSHLPITCVEGWSADGTWTGVQLRTLLDHAEIPPGRSVRVESLESAGPYRLSEVNPSHARDPLTLIATGLHGERLALDHGYPARLIAPNRPGVLQTKWIHRIVMLP